MRSADVCAAVLTHLRIHARASIAELTVAVYGFNDNRSKRDSVAKAVQQLELDGSIVTAMEEVRNARGRRMPARIAYLPAAAPVIGADSHPLGDPIELAKLAPNAPLSLDDRGRAIACDERAAHQYAEAIGQPTGCVESCRPGCALHPPCDDECKRYGCVKPAAPYGRWEIDKTPTQAPLRAHPRVVAWYASQPDPVVITPDGEMWAVNEGFTAFDVVQAWHTEHGNLTPA